MNSSRRALNFSSEEAEKFGLINRVFEDENFEEEVKNYFRVYEKVSRSAVVLSKKLLYQMDGMTFETALETGAEVNTIARLTEDCRKGIAKFLNK